MERPFAKVTVTEKGARSLRSGHPWVFAGEVLTEETPVGEGLCDSEGSLQGPSDLMEQGE